MLVCFDIGNTHILIGIFNQDTLVLRCRYATNLIGTSDQFGIFLINILQNAHLTVDQIKAAAVCSVVPSCDYTIKHTISSYFKCSYFILKSGVKTGLQIKYKN